MSSSRHHEHDRRTQAQPSRYDSSWPIATGPELPRNLVSTTDYAEPQTQVKHAWKPGVLRRFPVVAVFALIGSFACTVAAVVILLQSDGVPIASWKIAPSIYLAITSVVGNALLGVALSDGLTISFWRQSLVPGPLSSLHWYFEAGNSSLGAFRALIHGSGKINAIACLAVTAALARGPLNQKASYVQENVVFPTNGSTTVHVAQILPFNYTGYQRVTRVPSYMTAVLTPMFANITNAYSIRSVINTTYTPCGERCSVQVSGFGFDINCTTAQQELNYGLVSNNNGTFTVTAYETDVFSSDVRLYYQGTGSSNQFVDPRLELFTSTTSDAKTLRNHTCHMYAALVRYNINLANGVVNLRATDYNDDHVIERLPEATPQLLGGFQLAAQNMFQSTATWNFAGAVSSWIFTGSLANNYLSGSYSVTNMGSPNLTWNDPMNDMINAIRELGFRAAIQEAASSSTGANSTQLLPFTGSEPRTLYAVRRTYMIIAAALGIVPGIIVAITLRGWWSLGRKVSMSPLELANAFDSPLMRHVDDNASIGKVLDSTKGMRVKYGDQVSALDDAKATTAARRVFQRT